MGNRLKPLKRIGNYRGFNYKTRLKELKIGDRVFIDYYSYGALSRICNAIKSWSKEGKKYIRERDRNRLYIKRIK